MNYYRRYVGDYMRDTADLSLAEHGAYTVLLDHYYATEKPLPADFAAVCRICRAMTPEEQAAVRVVADRFFPVTDDGLRHNARADEEIGLASKVIDAAKANGKLGGRPKKPGNNPAGSDLITGIEPANNHPPTTNHHPPATSHQPPPSMHGIAIPEWVDLPAWSGWMEMRAKKKTPCTPDAVRLALRNLIKFRDAGQDPTAVLEQSTLNGWAGLFPVKEAAAPLMSRKSRQQRIEDGNRQVADEWANGGGHAR